MTVLEKGIPADLLAHYRSGALTVCKLARVLTTDGRLFGFADLDVGVDYDPSAVDPFNTGDDWGALTHVAENGGFSLSMLQAAADMSVDNADLTLLPGNDSVTVQELQAGLFDSADVRIYRVNYMDLSMGHECVAVGRLGTSRVSNNIGFVGFRSLADQLKQMKADLYTVTCPHRLGSPQCPKDFTWTTGTVTHVDTSNRIFSDASLTPADDAFVPGVMEWLTGNNAGRQMDVEQNTAGTFALMLRMGYAIQINDTFRVRPDCTKVWEDADKGCLFHWPDDRFRYFGGYPHARVGDPAMIPGALVNES